MRFLRMLGLITLLLSSASAQRIPTPLPPSTRTDNSAQHQEEVELQRQLQKQRLIKRTEDMKRDSQRLLELATELKAYVDKAGGNMLSLEVVRKAEEMEKLARQVKNNMRAQ